MTTVCPEDRRGQNLLRVRLGSKSDDKKAPAESTYQLLLLFLLPSDNVQHDLQHGPLITFPKEEKLGNKRKPMHQVCQYY